MEFIKIDRKNIIGIFWCIFVAFFPSFFPFLFIMADVFFVLTVAAHFFSIICLIVSIFVLHHRGQGTTNGTNGTGVTKGDPKFFLTFHYFGIILFHVGSAGNIIIRYFKGLEETPPPDFYTVNEVSLAYQHLFHLGTVVGTLAGLFYIVNLWHGLVQALEKSTKLSETIREFMMAPNRMKRILGIISAAVLFAHTGLLALALTLKQPVADTQWIQLISAIIKIMFLIITSPIIIDLYSTIKAIRSYGKTTLGDKKGLDLIRPILNLLAVLVFLYLLLAFDVQDNFRRCIYSSLLFNLPRNDVNHTWLIGKIQINIFYLFFAFIGTATAYPVLYKVIFRASASKQVQNSYHMI